MATDLEPSFRAHPLLWERHFLKYITFLIGKDDNLVITFTKKSHQKIW